MRLGALLGSATLAISCASAPETEVSHTPTPEEQLEQDLAAVRRPPAASASGPAPWRPVPRDTAAEPSAFAACRSKIGAFLVSELSQRQASDVRPVAVSAEFHRQQEDDAYPGLRFVGPLVAIGELAPAAIVKLCESAELKWIEQAPKSFLSR